MTPMTAGTDVASIASCSRQTTVYAIDFKGGQGLGEHTSALRAKLGLTTTIVCIPVGSRFRRNEGTLVLS